MKNPVFHVPEPTEDIPEVGWYFADEAEQPNGPYLTASEAWAALSEYAIRLNTQYSMIVEDRSDDPIFYVPETDELEELEPGWYFHDKVLSFPVGPWDSEEEARENHLEYAKYDPS